MAAPWKNGKSPPGAAQPGRSRLADVVVAPIVDQVGTVDRGDDRPAAGHEVERRRVVVLDVPPKTGRM